MKLLKLGYKLIMHSRYYFVWSKLYRFLFQRKYKHVKLKHYSILENIDKLFLKLQWRKDGFKELWDSIGSANWVQYCLDEIEGGHPQPKGALDCDDFSNYAANVYMPHWGEEVYLCSIGYKKSDKKISGHMICVVKRENGTYSHLSNWGLFNGFEDIQSVIKDILKNDKQLIGYSLIDPKRLKLLSCKTSL